MRFFRALWTDKSLLLVAVPVVVLAVALVAARAGDRVVEGQEAGDSDTTTTSISEEAGDTVEPAEPGADELAGGAGALGTGADGLGSGQDGTGSSAGFETGGVTVTDDNGNLVRIPNDIPLTGSAPAGSSDAPVAVSAEGGTAPPSTTPDPSKQPPSTPPSSPAPATTPSSTPTPPSSTTTTQPVVEPPPAVPESPLTALLPVSAVIVAGLGWIGFTRRRRSAAEQSPPSSHRGGSLR